MQASISVPAKMYHRQNMSLAIAFLAVILCFHLMENIVDAQVTFSRDWTPGKRAGYMADNECSIKPVSSLCQMLLNEIRVFASCEARSLSNYIQEKASDQNGR